MGLQKRWGLKPVIIFFPRLGGRTGCRHAEHGRLPSQTERRGDADSLLTVSEWNSRSAASILRLADTTDESNA
jgi:hypothetical protein